MIGAAFWLVLVVASLASFSHPDQAHQLTLLGLVMVSLPVSLFLSAVQRRRTAREVAILAFRDDLTGLKNRRVFTSTAQSILDGKPAGSLVMVLYDVDGLKTVNDECGHQAGDELLREVARYLEINGPAGTSVYRIGGDEFALLLNRSEGAAVAPIVRKMRGFDMQFSVCGHEHSVKMSCGLAFSEENDTFDRLFHRADVILRDGKDRLYASGVWAERRGTYPPRAGAPRTGDEKRQASA